MRCQRFEPMQLAELMTWFTSQETCQLWGGPSLRFPCTLATFREDSRIDSLSTWALVGDDGTLAGFGQYYARVGRCHLARLAIAPLQRRQGLGGRLVRELCERGADELGLDSFSLFVLARNERALRLYEQLGFRAVPYPEPLPLLEGCIYMVATSDLSRMRER